jgi:hypothetical protein
MKVFRAESLAILRDQGKLISWKRTAKQIYAYGKHLRRFPDSRGTIAGVLEIVAKNARLLPSARSILI